jgi:hypothetical protein
LKSDTDPIPGVPRTIEELNASIERSLEDIKAGRTISLEELEKEIESWYSDVQYRLTGN